MEKDPRQQQTQPGQQPEAATQPPDAELSGEQLEQVAGARIEDPDAGGE